MKLRLKLLNRPCRYLSSLRSLIEWPTCSCSAALADSDFSSGIGRCESLTGHISIDGKFSLIRFFRLREHIELKRPVNIKGRNYVRQFTGAGWYCLCHGFRNFWCRLEDGILLIISHCFKSVFCLDGCQGALEIGISCDILIYLPGLPEVAEFFLAKTQAELSRCCQRGDCRAFFERFGVTCFCQIGLVC